jgi:hypothetical protein
VKTKSPVVASLLVLLLLCLTPFFLGCGSKAAPGTISIVASSSIANGSAEQSTATATYSDGTQQDVTSQVTWSVVANTPSSVAKDSKSGFHLAHATSSGLVNVNQSGIDSATTPGTATLQASLGGAQSQSTVIVTNATITALAVMASDNEFPTGSAQPVQLIGTFFDGSTQDLSLTANWQSSNPAIATISSSTGPAMGVSPGSVVFSGSFGGQTGIFSPVC